MSQRLWSANCMPNQPHNWHVTVVLVTGSENGYSAALSSREEHSCQRHFRCAHFHTNAPDNFFVGSRQSCKMKLHHYGPASAPALNRVVPLRTEQVLEFINESRA